MKKNRGFTLIELLIVLVILALVTGLSVFAMDIFKSASNLEHTSQALSSRLRLAQMEALFEQEAFGLALDEEGYQFYRKSASGESWEPIHDDSLFKAQVFPSNTQLSLTVNGKLQTLGQHEPQLILQNGQLVPFSLSFQDKDNKVYEVSLNDQGEIEWTTR